MAVFVDTSMLGLKIRPSTNMAESSRRSDYWRTNFGAKVMPTALQLSREEWDRYIERGARVPTTSALTKDEERARGRLLERVKAAAAALKERFKVRRVVLFGSLAHAAWYMADSDIDLAVEGLTPEDYWQAWELVEEIIQERPVDLIDIEIASDSLRQAIERHGIEL